MSVYSLLKTIELILDGFCKIRNDYKETFQKCEVKLKSLLKEYKLKIANIKDKITLSSNAQLLMSFDDHVSKDIKTYIFFCLDETYVELVSRLPTNAQKVTS